MHCITARLALALSLTCVSLSAATLTADYRFNGNLNDALPGGSALTSFGGSLATPGLYTFAAGQGLSASNFLLNGGEYSLGIRFEFDTTSGWRKLVDFKDRTVDCGQYVNGGLAFYCLNSGGSLSPDTFYNVVLTRSSAGTYSTYVNGSLVWSISDVGNNAVFSGSNLFFFMDDFANGGEISGGTADRILIYDGDLSASEVAALDFGNEPFYGSATPEPSAFALAGIGFALLGARKYLRRAN